MAKIFPLILWLCLASRMGVGKTTPLRIHLDWFPSIEFAGILTALDKGWYREEGLDVQPQFTGLEITDVIRNGGADIGMHSGHEVIRQIGRGATLKAFAANYQFNPLTLITPRSSPVLELKDFRGRTIGIFSDQEYDVLRVILATAGLSLKDVKFKRLNTFKEIDLIEILKRKEVDGFLAWEFNWPITFTLQGYPVRQFPSHENGFHFYGIVFFAKPHFITEHRKELATFLKVTARGWKEVYRDPSGYTKRIIAKWYPKDRYINGSETLTLKQQLLELKIMKRYLFEGVGEGNFGLMSRFKWERGIQIAKANGLIPDDKRITVDDVVDTSLYQENAQGMRGQ